MLTGITVSLLAIVLLVFLLLYKKGMIIKTFTLDMNAPAKEFSQQLEQTADTIIRRLEEEANQLELLLDEAESKIGMLSQQVEHANNIIAQLTELQARPISTLNTINSADFLDAALESEEVRDDSNEELPADTIDVSVSIPADDDAVIKETINLEKHRLVLAMADQGYSATEIAKAVGVGKGEVMLLLQLNKK